ncbi:hypothetical protein COLO4_05556 [Corchorus olitorius]|uniref:Uncharacterized protein n=1 Tax=Corchorus olitorius TaxID=93759 RepID=A0A1R3KQI8_9ROSI|nr:hypothetical protein COLO4_05556 [Corchorus olitorius]
MRKPIVQLNQLTNGGRTEISESIGDLTEKDWIIFVEATRKRGSIGFGCYAMARNQGADTHIVCRTFDVEKEIDAKLLILRSILVRLKIYGKGRLWCQEGNGKWRRILQGKTIVGWETYPAMADVKKLSKDFQGISFFRERHPIARETKKLAQAATGKKLSLSWP